MVTENAVSADEIKVDRISPDDAKSIRKGAVTAPKLGSVTTRIATATGTTAVARCLKGERLLGGGGTTSGPGPAELSGSAPSGNSWRAFAATTGPSTVNSAYALCLRK